MNGVVPNVLSIAGSDPSGGAGIQADLRTFAALGVFGCAALAALTAQNTMEVRDVHLVPAEFLRQQLDAVFTDVRLDAVKIGMLGSPANVRVVADALRIHRPPFTVLDPVHRASSGATLSGSDAFEALARELLPLVTVVTPNASEAARLLHTREPRSVVESREAAEQLVARGARAALVTGGHLQDTDVSVDVLYDGQAMYELSIPRVPDGDMHGTGCTLSSAIAALLATGRTLPEACREAQIFVAGSMLRAAELRVGRGPRPVNQLRALIESEALRAE